MDLYIFGTGLSGLVSLVPKMNLPGVIFLFISFCSSGNHPIGYLFAERGSEVCLKFCPILVDAVAQYDDARRKHVWIQKDFFLDQC